MRVKVVLATYTACIDHCVETVTYGLRVGRPSQFGEDYIWKWGYSIGEYQLVEAA